MNDCKHHAILNEIFETEAKAIQNALEIGLSNAEYAFQSGNLYEADSEFAFCYTIINLAGEKMPQDLLTKVKEAYEIFREVNRNYEIERNSLQRYMRQLPDNPVIKEMELLSVDNPPKSPENSKERFNLLKEIAIHAGQDIKPEVLEKFKFYIKIDTINYAPDGLIFKPDNKPKQ